MLFKALFWDLVGVVVDELARELDVHWVRDLVDLVIQIIGELVGDSVCDLVVVLVDDFVIEISLDI